MTLETEANGVLVEPRACAHAALCAMVLMISLLSSAIGARAQTATPPDVVKLPSGINLGSSSFYDGFGSTTPGGWTSLEYFRWNDLTSINDSNGRDAPAFVDPHIDAITNLFHLVYASPLPMPNGALSFEAIVPVVDFHSHFAAPGVALRDNGLNFGDLTVGVVYQSNPIILPSHAVLSLRADLDITAPTGVLDRSKDLNQGSGFWSFAPYLAISVLPVPKWELSARLNYVYNLSTSRASDPPLIPGFVFRDGQAGQAAWVNFASSYEVAPGVRPGLNGWWLQQLADDRTNGIGVPGSRVEQLYLGPGVNWQVNKKNVVNFNIYLPISVKNAPAGPQFNILYIHNF